MEHKVTGTWNGRKMLENGGKEIFSSNTSLKSDPTFQSVNLLKNLS